MVKFSPFRTAIAASLPIVLIGAGIILRLAWVAVNSTASQMIGEANNVAISYARHGTLADAFRPGQGPTAHVMPLMPIIAGSIYRLFGVQTPAANLALTLVALALLAVTWTALYHAMALMDMPRGTRLGALALLTLVPLNIAMETIEFRVWEGGLATAFGATLLWHALRLERAEAVTTWEFLLLGFHAAVTLFVSPPIGVAAFACGGLLLVRRAVPARWPTVLAGVVAITLVVLTPWTLRNIVVMRRPIVLRDNFGLEFAQAFYPGADLPGDPSARFQERHHAIHPYQPAGNAAMLAAGGEIHYYDMLGMGAKAWVVAHPGPALGIALCHLRDFLFPPAWYWSQFGHSGTATLVKLTLNWIISAFGLLGLLFGAVRTGARFGYAAAMVTLPIVPYLLVEPTLRYRYLIVNLLTFIAAGAVSEIVAIITRRRASSIISNTSSTLRQ